MSRLSGYDSEVVGFDSVEPDKMAGAEKCTQTDYKECGIALQTVTTKDTGCTASAEELNAEDDTLKEYPPPGLNEFLRKVVPGVMEQLDEHNRDIHYNSSDSDEEEAISAKLLQEVKVKGNGLGAGDHQSSILAITWSSAGNSLALSLGQPQHENWCETPGLVKIYTLKRSEGDTFVHSMDISEKNCITALKYHPNLPALLAYGTTSGEVVLCDLRNAISNDGIQMASPPSCHGSRRVSSLYWADVSLANVFLTMQITSKGKRRGASDQILISSGSDGSINVWQVNANSKSFENVVCYTLKASHQPAPDITCFDFTKTQPLRPCNERTPDDNFVVGTKSGKLYLCKIKEVAEGQVDPVYEELEGHSTCILDVAFSYQKPGIFVSVSMDSELRVYDINQFNPLKIFCLTVPISCLAWLPYNPCVVLGLADTKSEALQFYNVSSGKQVQVDGLCGTGTVTCVAVSQCGSCRIAAGDSDSTVRIWELPTRRFKYANDDLDF